MKQGARRRAATRREARTDYCHAWRAATVAGDAPVMRDSAMCMLTRTFLCFCQARVQCS
jgi:hypothetical protein